MRTPIILYIEDSPFYQKMLSDIISADYTLHLANNGLDGVITALSKLPDFIFLDVMLPDIRGPELIKTIRTYLPNSYIVMVTSDSSIQTVSEAKEYGANGYVVKPFAAATIKKHLDKWIEEYGTLRHPALTPQITQELKRLNLIKQESETAVVKKNEYQLWMETKLAKVYPFIFLETIDVNIMHNEEVHISTVILAISIGFDGKINCIGSWNELKTTSSNPSHYLLKTLLKDLKSRGVHDVYVFIIDPKIQNYDVEFNISYPSAKIAPRFLSDMALVRSDLYTHKKLVRKLVSIISALSFEQSKGVLNSLKETLDKEFPELHSTLMQSLEKTQQIFLFPSEIRTIVFETQWIFVLKESFDDILKIRKTIESIQSLQQLIYAALAKKELKNKIIELKQSDEMLFSQKAYAEALFSFYQLMPDRFPEEERFQ